MHGRRAKSSNRPPLKLTAGEPVEDDEVAPAKSVHQTRWYAWLIETPLVAAMVMHFRTSPGRGTPPCCS
jgi:hypothetical protein